MKNLQFWEKLFYIRDRGAHETFLRPIILKALYELDYFKKIPPKIILIAGNNSAEITAHAIQELGKEHQHRVGVFLSHKLINLNERILFQGKHIASSALVSLLIKNKEIGEALKLNSAESIFLAALDYFEQSRASLIVIESGLGWGDPAIHLLKSDLLIFTDDVRHRYDNFSEDLSAFYRAASHLSFSRQGSVIIGVKNPCSALKKNLTERGVHAYWLGAHWQCTEDSPGSGVVTGIKRNRYLFNFGQYDVQGLSTAIIAWEVLFGRLEISKLLKAIDAINIPGCFQEISDDPYTVFDSRSSLHNMRLLAQRLMFLEEKKYLRGWNILCDLPKKFQSSEDFDLFHSYPRFELQFFTPSINELGVSQMLANEGIVGNICLLRKKERRRVAKFLHQMRLDAFLNKKGVYVFGSHAIIGHAFSSMGINAPTDCSLHCDLCAGADL